MKRNKLELTWVGKDERPRIEPRVLVEDPALSYRADRPAADADIFDNRLIFGDNLLALKALEQEFAGKVKCVFIDPPYNTGSAFSHYDDGVEHSVWLTLMRDRVEILWQLLATDGSLWVTLDDNEAHYFKVLADEIFGRGNFVADITWEKKYSKQNDAQWFSTSHDHVFVFAKNKECFVPNHLARSPDRLTGYSNPDADPRGPWQSVVYTCAKSRTERPNLYYPIVRPQDEMEILPSESRVWGYDEAKHAQHVAEERLWWGANGMSEKPRLKVFLSEVGASVVPDTLWLRTDVGDNQDAKREARALNSVDTFATPKPERLLQRIIEISSAPNDLVLDSFSGGGTTGAVAHKMGRRWIMIELGDHVHTHIIPRMRKVIDGADPGGITEQANWQGGGGFRYFRLATSLLERDSWGNWVINPDYDGGMLSEAVCKLEGFQYYPSAEHFWMHGHSTERDFIYVTTQALTNDQLQQISAIVGSGRSLLICCGSFSGRTDAFTNLTVKKIPASLLGKCEFGRDDYALARSTDETSANASDDSEVT